MAEIQSIKPIDFKINTLLAEGKNYGQIAEILNINRDTVARRVKNNPSIIEALEIAGVTDEMLANKQKELLEANRKLYNPKTQEFQDVPDNNARNTALSLAYKVKGHLKEDIQNQQNIIVNVIESWSPEVVKVEGLQNNDVVDITPLTENQPKNV